MLSRRRSGLAVDGSDVVSKPEGAGQRLGVSVVLSVFPFSLPLDLFVVQSCLGPIVALVAVSRITHRLLFPSKCPIPTTNMSKVCRILTKNEMGYKGQSIDR